MMVASNGCIVIEIGVWIVVNEDRYNPGPVPESDEFCTAAVHQMSCNLQKGYGLGWPDILVEG